MSEPFLEEKMALKDYVLSIMCAATAAGFGFLGFEARGLANKLDSDIAMLEKFEQGYRAADNTLKADEISALQDKVVFDKAVKTGLGYAEFGAAGVLGIIGVTALPWRRRKTIDDKLDGKDEN